MTKKTQTIQEKLEKQTNKKKLTNQEQWKLCNILILKYNPILGLTLQPG